MQWSACVSREPAVASLDKTALRFVKGGGKRTGRHIRRDIQTDHSHYNVRSTPYLRQCCTSFVCSLSRIGAAPCGLAVCAAPPKLHLLAACIHSPGPTFCL
ncbi:TPA: hypothetical protein ACH3X2_012969 [Trebouxia sp. C0005]